jgi:hypothetical protein
MGNEWVLPAAVLGLVILSSKKAPAGDSGVEANNADAKVYVTDQNGNVVNHNSPYSFNEGNSYTIHFQVKNTSTKGGAGIPATFEVNLMATSQKKTYIPITTWQYNFAAGETKEFTQVFVPSNGDGGDSGNILGSIQFPDGTTANGSEQFNVIAVPIIYSGTITFS